MKRKEFISTGLLLAGASLLNPFKVFGSSKDIDAEEAKSNWLSILEYARWAPSPHNIQPWKVKIISTTDAEILYEPKRLIPYSDSSSAFMTIGMSIFIESVTIAAANYGFKTTVDYKNIPLDASIEGYGHFANIKLVKDTITPLFDKELLKSRRTSRLPFNGKQVPDEVIKEMQDIVADLGHTFNASSDKDLVKWVLEINRDTLFSDLDNDKTRVELEHWIRFSDKEAHEKKDGLWYYCMHFPAWLMKAFFHHHERYNHGMKKSVLSRAYVRAMRGTTTVGWLSGPFATPEDWVNAGKAMTRWWLVMAKHKIYIHPFGSVITNKESHERLKEKLGFDENKNPLWLLARFGYSHEPPHSLRRDINDIIL